ncbi:MAG: hypothetical protein IKZ13_10385 [Akkermansia sp.]|jgi:uncharacterized membrane protein|nr:hypothetical protein [Akkermansia sp.]
MTAPNPDSSACIRARRRFVRWFVGICAGLYLVGQAIGWYRFGLQYDAVSNLITAAESLLFLPLPFIMLLLSVRSTCGSMMQLIGLIFPLLNAAASCFFCWADGGSLAALSFFLICCWVAILSVIAYFALFLLGLGIHRTIRYSHGN